MGKKKEGEYWICIVGPVNRSELKGGADTPMRNAVEGAFLFLMGRYPESLESGWGNNEKGAQELSDKWSEVSLRDIKLP